jgi:hypothetical protein
MIVVSSLALLSEVTIGLVGVSVSAPRFDWKAVSPNLPGYRARGSKATTSSVSEVFSSTCGSNHFPCATTPCTLFIQ